MFKTLKPGLFLFNHRHGWIYWVKPSLSLDVHACVLGCQTSGSAKKKDHTLVNILFSSTTYMNKTAKVLSPNSFSRPTMNWFCIHQKYLPPGRVAPSTYTTQTPANVCTPFLLRQLKYLHPGGGELRSHRLLSGDTTQALGHTPCFRNHSVFSFFCFFSLRFFSHTLSFSILSLYLPFQQSEEGTALPEQTTNPMNS